MYALVTASCHQYIPGVLPAPFIHLSKKTFHNMKHYMRRMRSRLLVMSDCTLRATFQENHECASFMICQPDSYLQVCTSSNTVL